MSGAVLAIDLGGTKAAFAVVDSEGVVLSHAKRPSREGGAAVSFDALLETASDTVRAAGLTWVDVRAAGVVVPGIYSPATGRAWAPNLWGRDEGVTSSRSMNCSNRPGQTSTLGAEHTRCHIVERP